MRFLRSSTIVLPGNLNLNATSKLSFIWHYINITIAWREQTRCLLLPIPVKHNHRSTIHGLDIFQIYPFSVLKVQQARFIVLKMQYYYNQPYHLLGFNQPLTYTRHGVSTENFTSFRIIQSGRAGTMVSCCLWGEQSGFDAWSWQSEMTLRIIAHK